MLSRPSAKAHQAGTSSNRLVDTEKAVRERTTIHGCGGEREGVSTRTKRRNQDGREGQGYGDGNVMMKEDY